MKQIFLDHLKIDIAYKSIKNINIRIRQNGEIFVSAPRQLSETELKKILFTKKNWIEKKQNQITARVKSNQEQLSLVEGKRCFIFGKNYEIKIRTLQKASQTIVLTDETIYFYFSNSKTDAQKKMLFDNWTRRLIKQHIKAFIGHYEPLMKVSVSEFGVKQMKTKWGTCNIRSHRIWLNLELYKYPLECLEYVVVHEMVHLLEATHNQRFWLLVESFMPNWKVAKNKLMC